MEGFKNVCCKRSIQGRPRTLLGRSFTLIDLSVFGDIDSDHFPLYVALCHDPSAAARQQKPEPEPEDEEAADEAIQEGREEGRGAEDD